VKSFGALKKWCRNRHLAVGWRGEPIFGKIIVLEIAKQIAGSPVRLWKIMDWILWRSRPPPKWKKDLLTPLAQEEPEMWEHRPL
jgi:hypothetical protein